MDHASNNKSPEESKEDDMKEAMTIIDEWTPAFDV